MKTKLNRTGNPADLLIFAIAFCIPLWPLGTIIFTLLWLVLSLFTFNQFQFKQGISMKPLLVLFAGFFFMHILGLLWTTNLSHGVKEIKDDLNLLIFPLLFALHQPREASFSFIKKGFITGTVIACMICFGQGIYLTLATGDSGHMFYALFSALLHPTYFGLILIVSCMFLLSELLFPKETGVKNNTVLIILILLQVATISLLSSRIVYLAGAALVLYYFFMTLLSKNFSVFKNRNLWLLTIVSFFFFYLSISLNNRFAQVTDAISNISDVKKETLLTSDSIQYNSSTIRIAQFRYSMEILEDRWLLGVGTGDSRDELEKVYQRHHDAYALEHFMNPHSSYFHTWLMIGLPGLLLLLASLFFPFLFSVKNRHFLYQGFLVLIFISGFTDIISHATLGSFYAFMNSMLYSQACYRNKEKDTFVQPGKRI
ncbi:MAG TPA: O-antigen ligase family protein [Bacteroidia bacterium]|nr:O-antigen ligase family protein [Bacteroidia bacterium]